MEQEAVKLKLPWIPQDVKGCQESWDTCQGKLLTERKQHKRTKFVAAECKNQQPSTRMRGVGGLGDMEFGVWFSVLLWFSISSP